MSEVPRFTTRAVTLAKNTVGDRDESAAPSGGGGFADHALVSLHCLRVYLEKSYRVALDLLSEIPQIIGEIGLEAADLSHHSTLVKAFDRFTVAIDSTFFDRENTSRHYCRRTNYHVQTLKATALVDTDTQAVLDVHCTMWRCLDTKIGGKATTGWRYGRNYARKA